MCQPVNANGGECPDGDGDRGGLHEVDDAAQEVREDPPPQHVHGVGEGNAEGGHRDVGHRQIDQILPEFGGVVLAPQQYYDRQQVRADGEERRDRVEYDQHQLVGIKVERLDVGHVQRAVVAHSHQQLVTLDRVVFALEQHLLHCR